MAFAAAGGGAGGGRGAGPSRPRACAPKERRARRRTLLTLRGDLALLAGQREEAKRAIVRPEEAAEQKIPAAGEAGEDWRVRVFGGGLFGAGEYGEAQAALEKWEQEFPVEEAGGLDAVSAGQDGVRGAAERAGAAVFGVVGAGRAAAVHVPEAVWLRANCLMAWREWAEARGCAAAGAERSSRTRSSSNRRRNG